MMIGAALFFLCTKKKCFLKEKLPSMVKLTLVKPWSGCSVGREMWVTKAMRERGYETIARTETRVVSGETLEAGETKRSRLIQR